MNKRSVLITTIVLVVIAVLLYVSAISSQDSDTDIPSSNTYSQFTDTDSLITPYYNPDTSDDAVVTANTNFKIYPYDKDSVNDEINSAMEFGTTRFLANYLDSNTDDVYIQIDVKSISYTSSQDYSFNFYTDSPEQYFHYAVTDGATSIKPIGGGW